MTINIEKIANYLCELNVSEIYNWEIPFSKGHGKNIFSQQELNQFYNLTNFESNILLKKILRSIDKFFEFVTSCFFIFKNSK